MSDLKDILNTDDELNQDDLMKYLRGNASEEERFAIEKQMAESSFVDDAVEGLQHFKDAKAVDDYVQQLNRQLQKYTAIRAARKKRRQLKDNNWLILAIIGILALCIAGYLLIHFNSRP